MEKIFLKDAKVSLVTCVLRPVASSERRPVVVVHANLEAIDYTPVSVDEETFNLSLHAYQMAMPVPSTDKVENPMVDIAFFARDKMVSFRMPVQFLAVSYTLSAFNGGLGGAPIVFVDSRKIPVINPAKVLDISDVAFALNFADRESEVAGDFTDIFSTLVHDSVSYPVAQIHWDDVETADDNGRDVIIEEVMAKSLNAVLSLSKGDLTPLFHIQEMVSIKHEKPEEMVAVSYYFLVLRNILDAINVSSPAHKPAYSYDRGVKKSLTQHGNFKFSEILKEADLEESFGRILSKKSKDNTVSEDKEHEDWAKDVKVWDAPAHDSWHEEMNSVKEYLESVGMLEAFEEIATIDFYDNDVLGEMVAKHGEATTLLGFYLFIAMQAHKKRSMSTAPKEEFTAQDIVISWFATWKTDDWWELPSTFYDLLHYNAKNAADILMYGAVRTENGISLPGLLPVMVEVGVLLLQNEVFSEIDSEEFANLLGKLEFNNRDYKDFQSLFLRYHRKIHEVIDGLEEDESATDYDIVNTAVHSIIEPSVDFHKMAEVFMLSFPVLAEIRANIEHKPFTDEWEEVRQGFLFNTLLEVAENAGRNVRNVEFQ